MGLFLQWQPELTNTLGFSGLPLQLPTRFRGQDVLELSLAGCILLLKVIALAQATFQVTILSPVTSDQEMTRSYTIFCGFPTNYLHSYYSISVCQLCFFKTLRGSNKVWDLLKRVF